MLPCLLAAILLAFAAAARADEAPRFNRDVRPILSNHCYRCHGPDSAARQAELRLDRRDDAIDAGVIVPGAPDDSELIRRVFSNDADERMPPPELHQDLTNQQKETLRRWVAAGANYERHWSLIPIPANVPVPRSNESPHRPSSSIDAFIAARRNHAGLSPAPPALRERWLRRVTFDLTGLPPTVEQIDTYLNDHSPIADAAVVDRLLASPAYGERMANLWLDLARFADTYGYQADRDMHMWPWRDWAIRAFNDNLPYDDFITWQLAGDLLPEPTRDQRIATGMNRLHRQTNEGGSTAEEFRVEYVSDRVNTVGTAFLGLTLECARCHDHKFDPITQRDYYALSAFLNNIDEHGLYSHFTETAPTPAMLLYQGDQESEHHKLQIAIAKKTSELAAAEAAAEDRFRSWLQSDAAFTPPTPAATFSFDELEPAGDNRLVPGRQGQALQFSGDDAQSCGDAGDFGRTDSFSFSLWLKPQVHRPRTVVLHRSRAAEDSAFRGYSLVLDEGHPTFSLIHFWPGDALRVRATAAVPLNEWSHVAVTYDGSSRAAGVTLYVDGIPQSADVVRDQLSRDIRHLKAWGDSDVDNVKLALGARFRDVGFSGGAIDDLEVYDVALTAREVMHLAIGESAGAESEHTLREHYLARHDEPCRAIRDELTALRCRENDLVTGVRQIMVMRESADRRTTYVLTRGQYDARGDTVDVAVPSSIYPWSDDLPANRLGLARWLTADDHPLVARVAVNRLWHVFFGTGIVRTPEDFGSQGEPPSHPDLLDWLARQFVDSDWDVKSLCRLIALSSTYRQSSVPADDGVLAADPENRLLARGPSHRLSSEQIRDNALAVSGLLVRRLGGPSVRPYQPAGLWQETGTGKTYHQDEGEGLYRRSMYTFWRRTAPPPSMLALDATTREVCTARREETATPMQALLLLNDPQFVEAARATAQRLISQANDDARALCIRAFRTLTSRSPSDDEIIVLVSMYDGQQSRFRDHQQAALDLLAIGQSPRDESIPAADHAALTIVVLALMNHDECVMKR